VGATRTPSHLLAFHHPLADHLIDCGLDEGRGDPFQAYDWPGNIRELQNVIERTVILCASDTFAVEERWLKRESPPLSGPAVSLVVARAEHERALIEAALSACRGRPSRRGGQAGPAAADARIENQNPGHSPPALQNATG
jgi:transcriptional regulator of acetoin/glycerol metabolism